MFESTEFCRICTRAECVLIDITKEDADNKTYIDKLKYCIAESVEDNNVLPNLICETCSKNLNISYSFKQLCLQTKQLFTGSENENENMIFLKSDFEREEFKPDSFTTEDTFKNDLELDEIKEICAECGLECEDFIELESEIICNSCKSPCKECSKIFPNPELLQKHRDENHTEKKEDVKLKPSDFKCSICNFQHPNERILKVHMRVHSGERPYRCDICQESFSWEHHLTRHQKTCRPGRTFPCNICKNRYMNIAQLLLHMKQHEKQNSEEEKFREIEERIKRQKKITEKTHPHACTLCPKRFEKKFKLEMHIRSHTGERKYQCDICDKWFMQGGYLAYHKRIHSGERAFKCKICGSAFTQKNTLSNHMRVHDKHRKMQCWVCQKFFRYVVTLRAHLKSAHGIDYRAAAEMKNAVLNST